MKPLDDNEGAKGAIAAPLVLRRMDNAVKADSERKRQSSVVVGEKRKVMQTQRIATQQILKPYSSFQRGKVC